MIPHLAEEVKADCIIIAFVNARVLEHAVVRLNEEAGQTLDCAAADKNAAAAPIKLCLISCGSQQRRLEEKIIPAPHSPPTSHFCHLSSASHGN